MPVQWIVFHMQRKKIMLQLKIIKITCNILPILNKHLSNTDCIIEVNRSIFVY